VFYCLVEVGIIRMVVQQTWTLDFSSIFDVPYGGPNHGDYEGCQDENDGQEDGQVVLKRNCCVIEVKVNGIYLIEVELNGN